MNTIKDDSDSMGNTSEEGYILFALRTDWQISSVELSGEKKITLLTFNHSEDRNYFLAPVPAGHYEISKINLYYRKYFQLDNDELIFDFTVEPRVINYVGELRAKKFPDGRAYFELINRSSIALEYLEEKFPLMLASRELKYTGPGKDDFFEEAVNKPKRINAGGVK